ncbi:MAG: septal ring lytic transglycosylase RlpA family protein [Hyphomicrobiaceae bacterium]
MKPHAVADCEAPRRHRQTANLRIVAATCLWAGLAGIEGGTANARSGPTTDAIGAWTTTVRPAPPAPRVAPAPNGGTAPCTVGASPRRKIGTPYTVAGITYVPAENPQYDEIGEASWYGEGFHGKPTANGELYDQASMTAAHPTLPMPSFVRVTNLANGRTVLVRVNNRGPFKRGRIIDVSKAAADALGFAQHGITRVRVQYVGPAPLEFATPCRSERPQSAAPASGMELPESVAQPSRAISRP